MGLGVISWTGSQALSTTFAGVMLDATGKSFATGIVALSGLYIYLTSVSGAAQCTVRLARDANGDELLTPDFAADIDTGKTTATDGTVIIDFARMIRPVCTTCYVFVKTDAGTATMTEVNLTYTSS